MKAYAIKDPQGNIIEDTVRSIENYSICWFIAMRIGVWQDYELHGYRCVPVEITEIKK